MSLLKLPTFVVTANNRYADQYEHVEYQNYKKEHTDVEIDKKDSSAFFSTVGFSGIIGLVIYFMLSFF